MPKPKTHAEYFATIRVDQRDALVALSEKVLARLPPCDACLSYAMPAWRLAGSTGSKTVVIGMAAFTKNLGLYPFSGTIIPQIEDRLTAEGIRFSKSGISFPATQTLPDWVLDELINRRLAEIG